MVVLTRALGIPSRLAVGYVGGTYDEENDYLVVTADQAHSWVEVYFPEYGWVTFEPTAGRVASWTVKMAAPLTTNIIERDIVFEEQGRQLSGLQITPVGGVGAGGAGGGRVFWSGCGWISSC